MDNNLTEISERLIACKGFRWMPGLQTLGEWRIINVDADGVEVVTDLGEVVLFHSGDLPHIASSLPDLTDPATLGCLLQLVRDAWGDPYLCCVGDRETGWRLDGYAAVEDIHSYSSEAEALFVALQSASRMEEE